MRKIHNFITIIRLCFYLIKKRDFSAQNIIEFCEKRLAKKPHDPIMRRILAWFYEYVKDYLKAAQEYKKLIDEGQESIELYKALGRAQRRMGDYCGAITTFKHAHRMKPVDLKLLGELGYTYMCAERFDEALEIFDKAIQKGHSDKRLNDYRGFCFQKLGDYERAVDEYEKALIGTPTDRRLLGDAAMAHTNLGVQLSEAKNLERAAQEFHRAMELDPNYLEAYVGLANVMFLKREFGVAIELGNTLITKNPFDYRGYLIVSSALKEKGKIAEAIDICEKGKVQANDPEGRLASFLSTLYRSLG